MRPASAAAGRAAVPVWREPQRCSPAKREPGAGGRAAGMTVVAAEGVFLADEHHGIVNAADKAGDRKVIDDTGISGAAVEGNIPRGNAHQCEGEDGGVEVFFGGAADPDFHHLPVTDGKSA